MVLTEREAVEYVYGSDAEAVANAVCFALGLASTRDEGAGAIANHVLALPDESLDLVAFSSSVDILAWALVTALKGAA